MGCETCKHANWERTPTGRISKNYSGRCTYPIKSVEFPSIPVVYQIQIVGPQGIWPGDGEGCPCYEKSL